MRELILDTLNSTQLHHYFPPPYNFDTFFQKCHIFDWNIMIFNYNQLNYNISIDIHDFSIDIHDFSKILWLDLVYLQTFLPIRSLLIAYIKHQKNFNQNYFTNNSYAVRADTDIIFRCISCSLINYLTVKTKYEQKLNIRKFKMLPMFFFFNLLKI